MTIGELAVQSGLRASTIGYWEKIGVMPKAARSSGQRRYTAEAVHLLAALQLARACGFGLEEMRQLVNGFSRSVKPARRWQELAASKREELDQQMAQLRAMRRLLDRVSECRCAELTECGRMVAA